MTGHRSFEELRKRMSRERRARNAEATRRMLAEMAARLPEGAVTITNFSDLGNSPGKRRKT
jgi:hypothetical protein